MSNGTSMPPAGAGPLVASGSKVVLVVSRGPSETARSGAVAVPDVVGKTQGDALGHLQGAGLNAQIFNDFNTSVKRGHVIDQFPVAGQMEALNSEVVLLVSNGPAVETSPTALPDVVGLTEDVAVQRIQTASLSTEVVREYHPNVAEGLVFAQLPSQSSVASTGKKSGLMMWLLIALAVVVIAAAGVFAYLSMNKGKPVTVPNVVGMTQEKAQTALTAVGLKVTTVPKASTKAVVGTVLAQTPAAGGVAQTGSSVQLELAVKPAPVSVPDVVGTTTSEAEATLKAAALVPSRKSENSASVPKDQVITQSPAAGVKVDSGSKVTITISKGPQITNTVTVPDLVGLTQKEAVDKASAVGLSSKVVPAYSSTVPTGVVSAQSPGAGQSVASGSTIGLTVSLGAAPPSSVEVPNVQGETKSSATSSLKAKGFVVTTVTWDGTGKPADQVVDQSPKAGAQTSPQSTVIVFVSSGN